MVANGWDGDRTSLRGETKDRMLSAQACRANDIIVFQRPDEMVRVQAAGILKGMGKKIVFENDDTYKIEDPMKFGGGLKKRNKALDTCIELSDLVTTTTEYLANEYRQLNDNVVVLPNCVDPFDWPERIKRNNGDKVRIGIVGSVSSNGDFDPVVPALKKLNERDDITIVLFGLPKKDVDPKVSKLYKEEYAFWDQFNVEWQPFVPIYEYFDTLNDLRLDLMLIPRKDNYFNRCKSNIKFLEASMLEIPVIAQGFEDGNSPYQADLDGENGVVVVDNDKWYEEICKLIDDKKLRRAMGKQAKKYVLNNYSIDKNAHKWVDAYKKLYDL